MTPASPLPSKSEVSDADSSLGSPVPDRTSTEEKSSTNSTAVEQKTTAGVDQNENGGKEVILCS